MLGTIILKEIVDSITSMKFIVTFVVVTGLVLTGLAIGAKDYKDKLSEFELQPQRNEQMLETQSNWLAAGYIGVFETKKPYVLSIFDSGVDNSLGRTANVTLGPDARLDESRNLMAPILAVFGEVDLTFIVKTVLSLFVILLTYDSISGEKERGTLKLTLSNEVGRATFILGKILGGYITILIAYLLPMLLGLSMLYGFFPDVMRQFDAAAWIRLGIINLAYFIYLALFFALGLFVSAISKRSATSFIILLMAWVLFVTIIPRLSLNAAERLVPHDSYATLQTEGALQVSKQRDEDMKDFLSDGKAWGEAFQNNELHIRLADMFDKQVESQQKVYQEIENKHDRQQQAQINLAESASRTLSPTSALSFVVQNLAGTGYKRQIEYENQIHKWQSGWRKFITDKVRYAGGDDNKLTQQQLGEFFSQESLDIKLSDVKFTFREESLNQVLSRAVIDMAVLAIMTILFFVMAFVAFMRYDVR